MNIADLSFNDVALLTDTLVGGILVYEDEHGRVIRIDEPLHLPTRPPINFHPPVVTHPPVVIHPRPRPRPRPGHLPYEIIAS
jgi:hypothetical protein